MSNSKIGARSKLSKAAPQSPTIKTLHPRMPVMVVVGACSIYWAAFAFSMWTQTGKSLELSTPLFNYTDLPYHAYFNNAIYSRTDPTRFTSHSFENRPYSPGQFFTRKFGSCGLLCTSIIKLYVFLFSPGTPSPALFYSYHAVTITSAAVGNFAHAAFLLYACSFGPSDEAMSVMMQMVFLLVLEAAVMLGPLGWYHVSGMKVKDFKFWANKPIRYTAGQDEGALANVTVSGITLLCSGFMSIPLLRDLFSPGTLLPWFPGDASYLIFTRAYVHSPPSYYPGFPEEYIGDRLSSQMAALFVLSYVFNKLATAFLIKKGTHLCPEKGQMISSGWVTEADTKPYGYLRALHCWKVQTICQVLFWMTLFRFYHVAVETEGYDMNFVFMAVVFETFVVLTYGYL